MPIAIAHKEGIQFVLDKLKAQRTNGKPNRRLADAFMELPDRITWANYYAVIADPRALGPIQEKLTKNRYRNTLEAYEDMSLVFRNALYYNEESSQIAKDAHVLKAVLEDAWMNHPHLPKPGQPIIRGSAPRRIPVKQYIPSKPGPTGEQPPSNAKGFNAIKAADQAVKAAMPKLSLKRLRAQAATDGIIPPPPPPQTLAAKGFQRIEFNEQQRVPSHEVASEQEADILVQRLDDSLPLWEGPSSSEGWFQQSSNVTHVLSTILQRLRDFRDTSGYRSLNAVEEIPASIPNGLVLDKELLTWSTITSKVTSNAYQTCQQFDKDVAHVLLKGRRFYERNTPNYARVLTLQRYWQSLNSSFPSGVSSVRAGPLYAKPKKRAGHINPEGITSHELEIQGNTLEYIALKGIKYRTGDFVHLSNPDEVGRPIIGQIWRCWQQQDGQQIVTVCWYYRPEQTVHTQDRMFYENEVLKTPHFVDHLAYDIIEPVAVQSFWQHIRGRPRTPNWYRGWSLYICESKYDDVKHSFTKLKNFAESQPPNTQRTPPSKEDLYLFEKIIQWKKLPSPFLRGVKSVGRLKDGGGPPPPMIQAIGGAAAGHAGNAVNDGNYLESGDDALSGRKRPRRGLAGIPQQMGVKPQGPGISQKANGYAVGPGGINIDRTVINATGATNIHAIEKLPAETSQFFDRDPITNETLWFSGPPLEVAKTPSLKYSLDYLYHMAMKEKKRKAEVDGQLDAEAVHKRQRVVGPPVSEIVLSVYGSSAV